MTIGPWFRWTVGPVLSVAVACYAFTAACCPDIGLLCIAPLNDVPACMRRCAPPRCSPGCSFAACSQRRRSHGRDVMMQPRTPGQSLPRRDACRDSRCRAAHQPRCSHERRHGRAAHQRTQRRSLPLVHLFSHASPRLRALHRLSLFGPVASIQRSHERVAYQSFQWMAN